MFLDYLFNPYGKKSEEQLYERLKTGIRFLKSKGCSKIIIACNTLSIVAINNGINEVITPVFYFIKAIKKYYDENSLIIATDYTISSDIYNLSNVNNVRKSSDLVNYIEGKSSYNIDLILDNINEYKKLFLGCTHFNLIKNKFKNLNIIDSGRILANNVNITNNCKLNVKIYVTNINVNIINHINYYLHIKRYRIFLLKL